MDPNGRVPWEDERCKHRVDGVRCRGVAIADAECFVHAPPTERERVLDGVSDGQDVTFTRGLIIDRALLDELIAHAASVGTERPVLVRADFSGATFVNVSSFDGINFAGGAAFEGTVRAAAVHEQLFVRGRRVFLPRTIPQ